MAIKRESERHNDDPVEQIKNLFDTETVTPEHRDGAKPKLRILGDAREDRHSSRRRGPGQPSM
ncbi:MAG: hypothetical protein ACRDRL_00855 [Sciscionella sp.]